MPKPPHIVIFNPDQWRGDALATWAILPCKRRNLDRLVATDAVSFRHAFAASYRLHASRCSFMTGWYPHVRGHRTMHHMLHEAAGEPNLLKTLRDNGYFVWWGGKNDLVPGPVRSPRPLRRIFPPTPRGLPALGRDAAPGHPRRRLGMARRAKRRQLLQLLQGAIGSAGRRALVRRRLGDGAWRDRLPTQLRRWADSRPLCMFLPLGYPHPRIALKSPGTR